MPFSGADPMLVAITGSSGLIGSALTRSLTGDGHGVLPVVRTREGHDGPVVQWDPNAGTIDAGGLEGVDAVVHLAGEAIAGGRWTDEHRRRIRESRTRGTALLSESLAGLERPPSVLVSGSGMHYYGDGGDRVLTESSPAGRGFLSEVCQAWEAATGMAAEAGIRVAHIRTAVVLSSAGGALATQLLPYKLGLGGRVGNGRQWFSWITLADHVAAMRFLIDHDVAGPVNLGSPAPVTNATFAKTLGRVLHRPAVIPLPRLITRLPAGIGPLVEELLFHSGRLAPSVLEEAGFEFTHPELEGALRAVID
ncbi:MAG: TIGR01777 family oxidoreductase [Acidimicrobiales bacterium]